jgi:hypothetical protein
MTDGNGPLPLAKLVRVSKVGDRKRGAFGVNPDHCEVGPRIRPDSLPKVFAPVEQKYADPSCVLHHMVIG